MLVPVARRQIDVDVACARHGDERQPDRAAPDHEDPGTTFQRDATQGVARDREGFHECADVRPDPVGQWHETTAVDDHLVGETAVDRHAVQA